MSHSLVAVVCCSGVVLAHAGRELAVALNSGLLVVETFVVCELAFVGLYFCEDEDTG